MPDLSQLANMPIQGKNDKETIQMLQDAFTRLRRDISFYLENLDFDNVKSSSWSDSIVDNVDASHKLKMKFYVSPGVAVKRLALNFSLEAFRAYETGAASGGGTYVTASIGNTYAAGAQGTYKIGNELVTGGTIVGGNYISDMAVSAGSHVHNHHFNGHQHYYDDNGTRVLTESGMVNIDSNTDSAGAHTHAVLTHGHFITHEHNITIENHTHDINYGIYESTHATNVKVYVDGVLRLDNGGGGYVADQVDLDITQYVRATGWHYVELSSSQLGRINAAYYIETLSTKNTA